MAGSLTSRDLALASIIGAAYAALVLLLPATSFFAWQVRVADGLLLLSTILGWPAIVGVTVGCFIGNLSAPWGAMSLILLDAVGGSVANLAASYAAYRIAFGRGGRARLAAAAAEIAIVTLIVGTYLSYILLGSLSPGPPLYSIYMGVLVGSTISIGVIGTALTEALTRSLPGVGRGAESNYPRS